MENNGKKQDNAPYIILDGVNFKKRELTGRKLREGRCVSCEAVFGIDDHCLLQGGHKGVCGCKINENYIRVNAI